MSSPAGCGGTSPLTVPGSPGPWHLQRFEGHDFLLADCLLQADGRSNKVLRKRAGECVAVVLINYLKDF